MKCVFLISRWGNKIVENFILLKTMCYFVTSVSLKTKEALCRVLDVTWDYQNFPFGIHASTDIAQDCILFKALLPIYGTSNLM